MVSGSLAGPTLTARAASTRSGKKRVVNSFEHNRPRTRRALLAGITEGAMDHSHDRLVEIRIVVNQELRSCPPSRR